MKKLVPIGDDFGFSEGINKGFVDAYENGFLKEMSLMVNSPGSENAARLVKEEGIPGVGLHITFTNLAKDGIYLRTADYEKMLNEKSKEELIDRIKMEIDEFQRLVGRLPSHINSHQYTDRHEKLFEFILDFAERNNIPIRNPKHVITGGSGLNNFDQNLVNDTFDKHKVKTTDYAESEIKGEIAEVRSNILKKLVEIPEGSSVEFAFHPGYVDDVLLKYTSLLYERERDVKLLTDKAFKKEIQELGFIIVDYKELFK